MSIVGSSLLDFLQLVLMQPREPLIPAAAAQGLASFGSTLPRFPMSGFECRLARGNFPVDLSICIERQMPLTFLGSCHQGVPNLVTEWSKVASPLSAMIQDIWLEYDFNQYEAPVLAPGIFVTAVRNPGLDPGHFIGEVARFLGQPLSDSLKATLARLKNLLPAPGRLVRVGFFFNRNLQSIRLEMALPSMAAGQFFTELGWPGPLAEFNEWLKRLVLQTESLHFAFDLSDNIHPRIGMVCSYKQSPKRDSRWAALFSKLVGDGLCDPDKVAPLLAWPGVHRPSTEPELWPGDIIFENQLFAPYAESALVRKISHLKIQWENGVPLNAKAYLLFRYLWFNREKVMAAAFKQSQGLPLPRYPERG